MPGRNDHGDGEQVSAVTLTVTHDGTVDARMVLKLGAWAVTHGATGMTITTREISWNLDPAKFGAEPDDVDVDRTEPPPDPKVRVKDDVIAARRARAAEAI